MFFRLIFSFERSRIKPDIEQSIRSVLQQDFGQITAIPIDVQLRKADNSWITVEAMFDTGATISLFSKTVGEEIGISKYVPHKISGISRKHEALVPIKVARVYARLIDEFGNMSPEFELWCAFAEEMVPNVLGMKDIVDRFKFESDPKENRLVLTWVG